MPTPLLALAPMEGVADADLRAALTAIAGGGNYAWGVSPFVRVTNSLLPERAFQRVCPELRAGGRTPDGTPMRVQLLGSDPACLAANAAHLATLEPAGVDLNFGCPAPTVNRHRGGAALLAEPDLLWRIATAVRAAVPRGIPFTAKMRLGLEDDRPALECALALQAGGVEALIVHGRTRAEGYRPPARWTAIARVREALRIPVIANGEVWTAADHAAIQRESGCEQVMLGRGALADPLLPRRIQGLADERIAPEDWHEVYAALSDYWAKVCRRLPPKHAPGRLKQWLSWLRRAYPQADALHRLLRPLTTPEAVDAVLGGRNQESGIRRQSGAVHLWNQ
ncbi:MAG: tRNA-dihydrouridine synthase [Zoogloeaceae bacterium]|jgi:tRNA-dihydrouridine synthase C|nr:tRNA-dihydrouridine synthase [Zoogloeaceae bacterium]